MAKQGWEDAAVVEGRVKTGAEERHWEFFSFPFSCEFYKPQFKHR